MDIQSFPLFLDQLVCIRVKLFTSNAILRAVLFSSLDNNVKCVLDPWNDFQRRFTLQLNVQYINETCLSLLLPIKICYLLLL